MLPAFDTNTGLPLPVVNLAKREGQHTQDYGGLNSIAEVGTLQLEFKYLSHLTDNDEYWRAAEKVCSQNCSVSTSLSVAKVMGVIKKAQLPHGLAAIFMM